MPRPPMRRRPASGSASRKLHDAYGSTPKAIRNRLRRGTLPARVRGNVGREVWLLQPGDRPEPPSRDRQGTDPDEGPETGTGPRPGPVALLVENARLLAELEGERRLNAELRRQLERELARGKRLEAELAEARAPLLARLLALLRH
jgi:hypothetical protein